MGGKFIGGFIVSKATAAKNAVNGKIDENQKLAMARDTAKEKATKLGSAISKGFGSLWSKVNPKKTEEKKEGEVAAKPEENNQEVECMQVNLQQNVNQNKNYE